MPELPEVETIRRCLSPVLLGRRFERVLINDPRLTRPELPATVTRSLVGQRVQSLDRRGKYLIITFNGDRHLLVHFRMTGSIRHLPESSVEIEADPYRRAVVKLDDGAAIAYRDVRRFGTWCVVAENDLDDYLNKRLGREPFDRLFTAQYLASALAGRRVAIKTAILDQRVVAGAGNIYADEALWWARLHPLRPAGGLCASETSTLRRGLRKAMRRGIERRGATLRDYRDPNGEIGQMQDEFRVYGREAEPCARCTAPIQKMRLAGRGTWFCEKCQA